MSDLELFRFPETGHAIRAVLVDGDEPWFVAADVCAALGHTNPSMAVRGLDPDERITVDRSSSSEALNFADLFADQRIRSLTLVSESGLYSLILRSNIAKAKAFKRWVTREVLPAIRKTGTYSVAPQFEIPSTFADALELAARQARAIEAANARMAELEPSAHAWDVLASAHGDYSVREAAFILNRDPSISTGQKRLFQALRDLRLIDSRDIPYAAHERHVTLRSRHYEHPHTREPRVTHQVRITVDGLRYLHKRLGGSAPFSSLIGDAA